MFIERDKAIRLRLPPGNWFTSAGSDGRKRIAVRNRRYHAGVNYGSESDKFNLFHENWGDPARERWVATGKMPGKTYA